MTDKFVVQPQLQLIQPPGQFVFDAGTSRHDFVYLLPRFTASPPISGAAYKSRMTTGASATSAAAACIAITSIASAGLRGSHFNAK
jgi:hypothetical protein